MAWALLQTDKPDKKTVIKAAERAYQLMPASADILDTYAEALIRFGQYGQCIKILEDSKITQKEPKLIYQLGTAYEKKNDLNKAVRHFISARAMMDSANGTIEMNISKAELERHIERILDKE